MAFGKIGAHNGYNNYPGYTPPDNLIQIRIYSDLHFDQVDQSLMDNFINSISALPTEILKNTIIIIAGDLCDGYNQFYLSKLTEISRYVYRLIYILGNHEYFSGTLSAQQGDPYIQKFRDFFRKTNVLFLHNELTEFRSFVIIGSPLFSTLDVSEQFSLYSEVSDFKKIKDIDGWDLTISRINEINKSFKKQLINFITAEKKKSIIVVTHFSPSVKTMEPKFKDSKINSYYMNNDDALNTALDQKNLLYWFFGHQHQTFKRRKLKSNGGLLSETFEQNLVIKLLKERKL